MMTTEEMEEIAVELPEKLQGLGDPAVAFIAATVWRVCAEICGRLDEAQQTEAEGAFPPTNRSTGDTP